MKNFMKNLAGISSTTANMLVRVELSKAAIPAFGITWKHKDHEVKADIVGLLHFKESDLIVTFRRAWTYWIVYLSQPMKPNFAAVLNQQFHNQIRINGCAGGFEDYDFKLPIMNYHVDTQEGLCALSLCLKEAFGECYASLAPASDLSGFTLRHCMRIAEQRFVDAYPGLYHLPAPDSEQALAELEISALVNLGGNNDYAKENLVEALGIATRTFGKFSRQAKEVRKDFAKFLQKRTNLAWTDYTNSANYPIQSISVSVRTYVLACELEENLSLRHSLLWALGRAKEAKSVKRRLDELREKLFRIHIPAYIIMNLKHEASLGKYISPRDCNLSELTAFRIASALWRRAKLATHFKRKAKAAKLRSLSLHFASMLSAEYAATFSALKDGRKAESTTSWQKFICGAFYSDTSILRQEELIKVFNAWPSVIPNQHMKVVNAPIFGMFLHRHSDMEELLATLKTFPEIEYVHGIIRPEEIRK